MPVRMLYAWLLRSSELCAGDDCKYKQQQEVKFRCEDCPLTILDEKRFNTLPGVVFENAMAEYNDIQIGFQSSAATLAVTRSVCFCLPNAMIVSLTFMPAISHVPPRRVLLLLFPPVEVFQTSGAETPQ